MKCEVSYTYLESAIEEIEVDEEDYEKMLEGDSSLLGFYINADINDIEYIVPIDEN